MKPEDLFGVIVRAAGLYFLYPAMEYFNFAMYSIIEPLREHKANSSTYALQGLLYLIVALALLTGAKSIVRIAYPETGRTEPE